MNGASGPRFADPALSADPEWIAIKRRTAAESGQLVREANGQPLMRVAYSPACKA